MTYTVTLNSPDKNVVLPNGTRYQGSAAVVLSDQEYSMLSPTALAALMSAASAGGTAAYAVTLGQYVQTPLAAWDFEDGVDGWKGGTPGNSTVAQSTAWAETGTHSLLVTASAAAAGAGFWQAFSGMVPVTGGKLYSGTAWLESPSAALAHTHLNISWYDVNQTFVSGTTGSVTALAPGQAASFSLNGAQAPATAYFAALAALDSEGSANGTQLAIDAAAFYQSVPLAGVVLPDGLTHKAGDVVTLSDAEFSTITPAAVAALFSSVVRQVV